mmetsp:Transcript_6144/g.13124  ORF Transcript_6144/g.13124 Transcript_6144/m.13124 type:complete len:530 (+) Transcript_6144:112-1701(+)
MQARVAAARETAPSEQQNLSALRQSLRVRQTEIKRSASDGLLDGLETAAAAPHAQDKLVQPVPSDTLDPLRDNKLSSNTAAVTNATATITTSRTAVDRFDSVELHRAYDDRGVGDEDSISSSRSAAALEEILNRVSQPSTNRNIRAERGHVPSSQPASPRKPLSPYSRKAATDDDDATHRPSLSLTTSSVPTSPPTSLSTANNDNASSNAAAIRASKSAEKLPDATDQAPLHAQYTQPRSSAPSAANVDADASAAATAAAEDAGGGPAQRASFLKLVVGGPKKLAALPKQAGKSSKSLATSSASIQSKASSQRPTPASALSPTTGETAAGPDRDRVRQAPLARAPSKQRAVPRVVLPVTGVAVKDGGAGSAFSRGAEVSRFESALEPVRAAECVVDALNSMRCVEMVTSARADLFRVSVLRMRNKRGAYFVRVVSIHEHRSSDGGSDEAHAAQSVIECAFNVKEIKSQDYWDLVDFQRELKKTMRAKSEDAVLGKAPPKTLRETYSDAKRRERAKAELMERTQEANKPQ